MYSYITRVLLICTRMLLVCTRMLLVCTRMSLVCTRMLLVCSRMLLYLCGVLARMEAFLQIARFVSKEQGLDIRTQTHMYSLRPLA